MDTNKLIRSLRLQLKASVDSIYKEKWDKEATKENAKWFGVPRPVVRKISREMLTEVKSLPKHQVLVICEEMLKQDQDEFKVIAFDWAHRFSKQFEPNDFKFFSRWVKEYLLNWGDCDDFCTHALGEFLYQYPEFLGDVRKWSESKKWQVRRASAVALIYSVRNKKYIREVFVTANNLLTDEHDLVRKGYGWMLKEASRHYPKSVFKYVMTHKQEMPRVALRYAIEKLSKDMKAKAMAL